MTQVIITPIKSYDLVNDDPPVHETTPHTTTPICPSVRDVVVVVQGITINGAVGNGGHLLVPHCVYAGMRTSTSAVGTSTAATIRYSAVMRNADAGMRIRTSAAGKSTAAMRGTVMRAAVRHVQSIGTITVPSTSTPAISTSTRCVTVHRVCIMPAPPRSPPVGISSCSCVPSSSEPRAPLLVRCSRSTSTHTTARARHHSHRGETTGGAHGARPEGTGTPERQATTGSTRAGQPHVPTATRDHRNAASTTGSTAR